MKALAVSFCLLLFSAGALLAQNKALYDVLLKNGTVITGEIASLTAEKVTVRLGGEVVTEMNMTDVERVAPHVQARAGKEKCSPIMPAKGFFNETELGAMVGSGNGDDKFNTGWTLQNVSGYRVNRHFSVGGGVGVEQYPEYGNTFFPLFARVSGDMLKRRVSPVYFADAGYSFIAGDYENGMEQLSSKGGVMVHGGLGLRICTATRLSVTFLAGFKMQRSTREYASTWYESYAYSEERTFLRHTFRLGLGF
jgi:hypothetical protein